MSETQEITLEEVVAEIVVAESYSPYKAITAANKVFSALGFAKKLPNQMGYNYNKAGMLGVKGSNTVTKDELIAWIVKYTTKNLIK